MNKVSSEEEELELSVYLHMENYRFRAYLGDEC